MSTRPRPACRGAACGAPRRGPERDAPGHRGACRRPGGDPRGSHAPAETWDQAAFEILLGQPGVRAFIAPQGGLVMARRAADEAEILTLAVLPAARRRGLGRDLLRAACADAAACGAATMFLEVSERNAAALALYVACGFTRVGFRREYYPGGAAALVMRRTLESISISF